ncbi:MAG: DNA polymerase III subunit delta, partial [Chloroflexi bacterium]|nr:DNA polymerase III subunit delta [Chloroflexota bacterium]
EQERARRFVAALESRSDGTFVVLIDPAKLGRRKADPNPIVAAVSESGTILQFSELRDADLHNWIRAHAGGRVKSGDPADEERARRLAGKITDEAVMLLEQRIGPGLRLLLSELDKLRDYAGDRAITESDVRLLVSETRQDTVFELVDAVAKLQTQRALTLVHRLLEAGEPAMLIIALLIRQFRGLLKVFDRASRGLPDYEAVQGTGLPSWKARELVAAARFLGRARLHEAIRTLHDVDLALKRGEIRDQFAAELLVLRLTSRGSSPRR